MSVQLRLAQVVKIIPKWRLCEIVFCDDGWRATDVPILTSYVSTNTGGWTMHNMPRPPDEDVAGALQPSEDMRTVLAMVAVTDGRPVIMGFLPHPMTQLAFIEPEQNRDIWRHPSGTIVTVNKNGSLEVHHTGGMFLKVGIDGDNATATEHEDLTGLCANENWVYPENDPPTVTLSNGKFRLIIRPNGDTEYLSGGDLSVRYKGKADVDIGGNATVRVAGNAEVDAGGGITARTPGNITASAGGAATVQAIGEANVRAGGSANVQAGGSAEVTAAGDVTVAAVGSASLGAGGSVTVSAAGALTVGGTAITLAAPLVTVLGELIVSGEPATAEMVALALNLPIVAAAAAGAAAGVAGAPPQVAQATAQVAAALVSVQEAERLAIETSEPAIGTGPKDNQGGEGPGLSA